MSRRFQPGTTKQATYNDGGSSSAQISFCVNPVLFENCGLLLDRHNGLTVAAVHRLRQESSNVTSISLANWKDLSAKVMGLPDATAYSIFDVYFALSGGCMQGSPSYYGSYATADQKPVSEFRSESNRALLAKMGGTVDETRWPAASVSRQVSLPGLLIFLLVQIQLDREPRQPLGETDPSVITDAVYHKLQDYLMVVSATRPGRVTLADVMELRILLREFANGVELPFGTNLGFLWPRNEKTIDIAILSQYVRPRILLPAELLQRHGGPSNSTLFTNNVVISGIHDSLTLSPTPAVPTGGLRLMSSTYAIVDCSQSSFYVPCALPHARLSKLSNCFVALGPVAGVLTIDRCVNCSISALCGAVVVSNCKNVTLYVCTNTPPVLCLRDRGAGAAASLENVRLAPFNSYYGSLELDLVEAGINPKLNLWNAGLPSQEFILSPEDFLPLVFPIAPLSSNMITTRTNPCTLPAPYQDAVNRRLQRFQETSKDLQDAYLRLEESGRDDLAEQLRQRVNEMFMEWLQETGQAKVLVKLVQEPRQ